MSARNLPSQSQHLIRFHESIEILRKQLAGNYSDISNLNEGLLSFSRCMDVLIMHQINPEASAVTHAVLKEAWPYVKLPDVRPAVAVLLLSAKAACLAGWFNPTQKREILAAVNELLSSISTSVCSVSSNSAPNAAKVEDATSAETLINGVLNLFCPRVQPSRILSMLLVKAGYQAVMCNFNVVSKLQKNERVRLVVIRTTDITSSSCLIGPPHASFVLNGRGIHGRTIVTGERGPQAPTDITSLSRFGGNLLQVVGEFPVDCMVAVALLLDCVWDSSSVKLPPVEKVDTAQEGKTGSLNELDDDLEEGPSRMTLNCPISHKRIRTPVKGSSCRHHQCFDLDDFLSIMERRPSWKCPCCNASLSTAELRLDVHVAKILEEVAGDASLSDVLLFPDGSWKPAGTKRKLPDMNPEASSCGAEAIGSLAEHQSGNSPTHVNLENGNDSSDSGRKKMTRAEAERTDAFGTLETKPALTNQSRAAESISIPTYVSAPVSPLQTQPLLSTGGGSSLLSAVPRNQAAIPRESPVPAATPAATPAHFLTATDTLAIVNSALQLMSGNQHLPSHSNIVQSSSGMRTGAAPSVQAVPPGSVQAVPPGSTQHAHQPLQQQYTTVRPGMGLLGARRAAMPGSLANSRAGVSMPARNALPDNAGGT